MISAVNSFSSFKSLSYPNKNVFAKQEIDKNKRYYHSKTSYYKQERPNNRNLALAFIAVSTFILGLFVANIAKSSNFELCKAQTELIQKLKF